KSGMFEIEEHEVAARRLEHVPDSRRRELHDEMAELRAPGLGQLLQASRRHADLLGLAVSGARLAPISARAGAAASRPASDGRNRGALSGGPKLSSGAFAPQGLSVPGPRRQNGFQVARWVNLR